MPLLTHSVIDPVGGDPVGVRSLEVRLLTPTPAARVYRVSDGAEVHGVETVQLNPVGGAYPSTWEIELAPNSDFLPSGTWYQVGQTVSGEHQPALVPIVVPDDVGPFRLLDLLTSPPRGGEPIVVGWTPAGDWTAGRTYYLREVVKHDGASWVARGTSTGVEPGEGVDQWQRLAAEGPVGPQGDPGPANTLSIGTVTTGAVGAPAEATISGASPNQTLGLVLPRGATGDTGATGETGETGETGATGPANSLSIGTVTASLAGAPAEADITGTPPDQTLDLVLPRGEQGPPGSGAPDATTSAKGSVRLVGGTADDPTYPVTSVTGLGDSATRNVGTTAGSVAAGNDTRLSDTRTPSDSSVTDAKVASGAAIAESKLSLASDAAAGTASRRTLGTGATQALPGNHASTTNARTPTAHKSTHAVGGTDVLTPADIAAAPAPLATQTIPYAAAVTPDASVATSGATTATGALTVNPPTGGRVGGGYVLAVTASGANRAVTLSGFTLAGATSPYTVLSGKTALFPMVRLSGGWRALPVAADA